MPRIQVKDHKIAKVPKQRASKPKPSIASSASGSRSQRGASGTNPSYGSWSKEDLVKKARQLGISGRSTMNKSQLVTALRKH
jgi:Rho termination factor, N-terminal domain